jgi:pantothenate kinase
MITETVTFVLNLAGQQWELSFSRHALDAVHVPLLKEIALKAAAKTRRYIVFLAGPPGSGKTTIGALWETLAQEHALAVPLQTLPVDGFHYPNTVLDARTILRKGKLISLRKIKGAPESFDLDRLRKALSNLCTGQEFAWPSYDRQRHDPVPNAIPVLTTGILVVEGNYLLLDEPGWRDLKPMADLTIFIEGDECLARARILSRAQRGGRTPANAVQHYEFNDLPNWQRVMQHRLASNLTLVIEH